MPPKALRCIYLSISIYLSIYHCGSAFSAEFTPHRQRMHAAGVEGDGTTPGQREQARKTCRQSTASPASCRR